MLVKTKAIVISALRYQEKSLIVKCFTESDGLKSYFIRDAFSSGKNRQKIAYFQPLNILEIEADHKNKGKLEYFKEVRLGMPFHTITTDIKKTTIAIFVSEMLHNSIKEVNFHLVLLLEITKFLGFYPDTVNQNNPYFEMTEGVFIPFETMTCLTLAESSLVRRLMGLRFNAEPANFTGTERQALLKILLDYYALHLEGFRRPNSLDVLKEVFS
jgi:DNA repair protein RecO (recombination protein O)